MEVKNYSGCTPQIQHSTYLMELNYKEKHAAPQCTIFRVLTNNILIDTIQGTRILFLIVHTYTNFSHIKEAVKKPISRPNFFSYRNYDVRVVIDYR